MQPIGGSSALDEKQRALLDFASEFVLFVDRHGGVVLGAGDGLHTIGYRPTEPRGMDIAAAVHPDDRPAVLELIARAQTVGDLDEELQVRTQRKDGALILIDARVTTVVDHPVLGTGAVVRIRQIGESDRGGPPPAADERFRSLAAALPTGVLSVDADGRLTDANDAALELLGRSLDDLVARGWEASVHAEDRPDVEDAHRILDAGDAEAEAVVRADVDGQVRWLKVTLVALGDESAGHLVALDDITERQRATAELTHRATHDALTGLPNRALFEDRLHQACARLAEGDRSVTLLFGDLDRFKEINDRHGHATGDAVLREVARRIQGAVRATDTVTRLGGDEFVIVCEDLAPADAAELAHRISSAVRQPVEAEGRTVEVAISVGIVTASAPDTDPTELLARADAEMYRRKQGGRPGATER